MVPQPIFVALLLLGVIPFSTALTNIFNFTSFSDDGQPIKRLGNTFVTKSKALELTSNFTPSDSRGNGWAVYAHNITLYDSATRFAADFQSIFSFEIIPPTKNTSCTGDGLTFFIAHADWTPNDLIRFGEGLGIFDVTSDAFNSQIIAIEFDTFNNNYYPSFDPSSNHMGIDVDSSNSRVTVNWTVDRSRNDSRYLNGTAFVWYNSTIGTLNSLLRYRNYADPLKISLNINLTTVLPETVVIGFSASTGNCLETHRIKAWSFSATIPEPATAPSPTPGIAPSPTPHFAPNLPQIQTVKQNKIVLILVACLVPLLLIVLVVLIVVIRERKKNSGKFKEEEAEEEEKEEEAGFPDLAMDFETGPRKFRYKELAAATNCFNEEGELGKGGFGIVYRGTLRDTNEVVAVKRFSKGLSVQGKKEYMAEVTVISRLRHRNLVKLIGWCHEQGELLLVYEYMEEGSVDSHLFSKKGCPVLPWAHRRKVVLGLASAILYLHEEWEQCIVHRDIKLSNVMVDSEFHARLGDFGLARLSNHGLAPMTTIVAGTMGYLAPECIITGKASTQTDVYSFGVVLLEIAAGRRVVHPIEGKEARLVEWIWELYGLGSLSAAVDERLGSEFDQQEMERMMVVGLWCVHPDCQRRPTMREAIRVLSFQADIPCLPQKMPLPFCVQPLTNELNGSLFMSSSSGTTATSTTASSMESVALLPLRGS